MTPFILTINFRTPISAGRLPSLDALLAAEIAKEKGDDAIENLPLAQTESVWHGSDLFIDAPGIVGQVTKYSHAMRERDGVPGFVSEPKRGFRRWKNLEGAYAHQAVSVGVYFGIGDIDAVEAIVRDVPAIGAHRNDGFGLIDSYAFDLGPNACPRWGLSDVSGNPARPVPLEVWEELPGVQLSRSDRVLPLAALLLVRTVSPRGLRCPGEQRSVHARPRARLKGARHP